MSIALPPQLVITKIARTPSKEDRNLDPGKKIDIVKIANKVDFN